MICVTSDDGSKLYLNDTLVIDNDGVHSVLKKCASIPTEGVYKLDLEYFENGGSSGLTLAFDKIVHPMTWVSVRETEAQQ
jgi:alpha-L-fucosidase